MREIRNPATLELLGTMPDNGPEEVAHAVAAARAAQPAWGSAPAADRAKHLVEIGARVRARERELASLLTRETGKPRCESIDCIEAVIALFEGCALAGAAAQSNAAGRARAGVVAALVPFNFPLLLMAAAIAPQIAAGSTVVCKPPQQNPLACLLLAEAFDALPAGVVTLVTGGVDTGRALVDHPGVDLIAFTGSAKVARQIAAAAPRKHVELELCGVDAFIVCEDADLDITVPAVAWGRLMNGGQACASAKHIYVARSIEAEFVERMHPCVGFLDVDDPIKASTDLGPLISLEAAHRVEDQVGRTLRDGATLILGGRRFRPSGLPGHFFQPTILTNVRPGSVPSREEILGPVITVTPVSGLAQALRMAGESGSAFGASIYARDTDPVMEALESTAIGIFRINDPPTGIGAGPLGGARHAAIRRILGGESAETVREPKQVMSAAAIEPKPWWFPYSDRRITSRLLKP